MKASELRTKSLKDLQAELVKTRAEQGESRRMHAAGELPNPRVLTKQRRQIAVLQTVINQLKNSANKEEA